MYIAAVESGADEETSNKPGKLGEPAPLEAWAERQSERRLGGDMEVRPSPLIPDAPEGVQVHRLQEPRGGLDRRFAL